jgi:HlyD family secretion protein
VSKVKKKIKRRNVLLLASVVVLSGAAVAYNYYTGQTTLTPYVVETGDLKEVVEATGAVESDNRRTVYAHQSGFVSALSLSAGDPVQAGDQLAILVSDDLYHSIQTAKANVSAAQSEYARASEQSDPLLAEIAETAVSSARLNVDRAQEALEDAKALYAAGAVSESEVKAAEFAASQAAVALTTAEKQLALQKKGVSGNLLKSISASITAAKSELARLQSMDGQRVITSEISGILTERWVEEGAFVMTGAPVAEVASIDSLKIVSNVVAKDLTKLSSGMKADIIYEGETIATGRILKIHPKLTTIVSDLGIAQKRVRVEISVENVKAGAMMLIGQDVDLQFIQSEKLGVVKVETDYVYEENGAHYVLVNEDGRLGKRAVELGIEGEIYYEIISGLTPGEQIVGEIDNAVNIGDRIVFE